MGERSPGPLVGARWTVFAGEDWHTHSSSTRQLAAELATRGPVLWMNGIGLRRPRLDRHDLSRLLSKLRSPAVVQPDRRAVAATAVAVADAAPAPVVANVRLLPFHGSSLVRRINRRVLRRAARRWRRDLGVDADLLVLRLPTAVDLASCFPGATVAYFCRDDLATLPGPDWPMVRWYEEELVERSDLVLVPNEHIGSLPRLAGAPVHVLRHGVDLAAFSRAGAPEVLEALVGPLVGRWVVGYTGLVNELTDLEILAAVARLPGVTVVVVGEVRVPIDDLLAAGDVRVTRRFIPHADVPAVLAACDVVLLPYRRVPAMELAEPIKLREYLASGRPIVATDVPSVRPFADVVPVATTTAEFVDHVATLRAHGEPPAAADARRDRVSADSWSHRANELLALVAAARQDGTRSAGVDPARAEQPLRIVHLVDRLGDGGLERSVVEVVAAQRRRGHQSSIVTLGDEGPLAAAARRSGIEVIALGKRQGPSWRIAARLAKLVRRARADIVVSHDVAVHHYAAVARAVSPRARLVNVRHGVLLSSGHTPNRRWYRLVRPLTSAYVFVSDHAQQVHVAAGLVPLDRSWTIHQPHVAVPPSPVPMPPVRAPASPAPCFGTVGRLVPVKGHTDLLAAFAAVARCRPGSRLVVVGDGPERPALEALAARLGIDADVEFTGWRDDTAAALAGVDVYVSASHMEGLPRHVVEAMAMGLPVAATAAGGTVELVVDGLTGWSCAPGDPDALAATMRRAVDAPDRAEVARRARERVTAGFAPERQARAEERLFRAIGAGRRWPR